jgi:hypothetical protein
MVAIEEEMGLLTRDTPQQVPSGGLARSIFLQDRDALPIARRFVVLLFLVAWLAMLLFFPTA